MWTGFVWIVIGHSGRPFLAVIMNFVAVGEGGGFLDQPGDYQFHMNAVMLLSLFLFCFTFRVALSTCPFFLPPTVSV